MTEVMDAAALRAATYMCKQEQVPMENELGEILKLLQSRAEDIARDSEELGQEATTELMDKLEGQMGQLIELQHEVISHGLVLDELPSHAEALTHAETPSAVQQILVDQVQKLATQRKRQSTSSAEVKSIKEIKARLAGEEPPAEDADEEMQMTEERITNFKCPISLVPMEVEGPNRPMTAPGHGPRCVFAHEGITKYFKGRGGKDPGGKIPCPICTKGLSLKELKPCLKMVRLIREHSESIENEGEDDDGMFVD